jgi:uncharacterized membrane protein YtjA (UPF0391 family)
MFYYALVLLVVGLIVGALHLAGVIRSVLVAPHFLWMRSAAPET